MPKHLRAEDEYQAEFDAQTLADAEAIKSDKKRMTKASRAASKMVKEQEAKARGLRRVAKKTTTRKPKTARGKKR